MSEWAKIEEGGPKPPAKQEVVLLFGDREGPYMKLGYWDGAEWDMPGYAPLAKGEYPTHWSALNLPPPKRQVSGSSPLGSTITLYGDFWDDLVNSLENKGFDDADVRDVSDIVLCLIGKCIYNDPPPNPKTADSAQQLPTGENPKLPRSWGDSILQPTQRGTQCAICAQAISASILHLFDRATGARAHIKCVEGTRS
jgi:hypothetical protein